MGQLEAEHRYVRIADDMQQPTYSQVGWTSFLCYNWISPLLASGVERQVNTSDTPQLAAAEDTLVNTHGLAASLDAFEKDRKRHPLIRSLMYTYWKQLFWFEVLKVAEYLLTLLNPILLGAVLVFQETQNEGLPIAQSAIRKGFSAVVGLIALGLFKAVFSSQVQFYQNRLTLRMTSALRGVVMLRCIQGRTPGVEDIEAYAEKGDPSPAVYNVISFDVAPNVDIIWVLLALWIIPIQFTSAFIAIFQEVRGAVLPGLLTIVIAKIISGLLLYYDGILRNQLLKARDIRLSRCNEGFTEIRTLQMLTWVPSFKASIAEARAEELRVQNLKLWVTKMAAALDYSLSTIVNLVTLGYFVIILKGDMKASIALPVINLIVSLIDPLSNFPTWVQKYLIWQSAYLRVNRYMGIDVYAEKIHPALRADAKEPAGLVVAAFKNCTLSWIGASGWIGGGASEFAGPTDDDEAVAKQPLIEPEPPFALRNLDLHVGAGELLVLSGQAGQGKTSVLHGLLAEMAVEEGYVQSPAVRRHALEQGLAAVHRLLPSTRPAAEQVLSDQIDIDPLAVPYAAQNVTLFSGTIRSNILFGTAYTQEVYSRTVAACSLVEDIATMPAGELTEVAQGGATLSTGQKARVGLARAVYRATLALHTDPDGAPPLVLLDDPFCALDRRVAREVCHSLLSSPGGLLTPCAVVLATADPWWLNSLRRGSAADEAGSTVEGAGVHLAVVRGGSVVAQGRPEVMRALDLPEIADVLPYLASSTSTTWQGPGSGHAGQEEQETAPHPAVAAQWNPQDENAGPPPEGLGQGRGPFDARKTTDAESQTPLPAKHLDDVALMKKEHREDGQVRWSTYAAYLQAVGPVLLTLLVISLTGISLFQNLCSLWIAFWTSADKQESFMYKAMVTFGIQPPLESVQLLIVYGCGCACFTASNFAGRSLEIIGGIRAARTIFLESLTGTLSRPFGWWDSNPTGRVLNRFTQDVDVMDNAVTNIMGVIFGAVLFFIGHVVVLGIANPISLALLPLICLGLEYYASFYRLTIREIQRNWLVCMSSVYQDMVEAIMGNVTVRAFGSSKHVLCSSMVGLEQLQRVDFAKTTTQLWVKLRMAIISYALSVFTQLYPVFQFYGVLNPQSAALVGFSIDYSRMIVNIVQQFVLNYSDLEMQLVSIERLREYTGDEERQVGSRASLRGLTGLHLQDVAVTYREGIRPALSGVSLSFPQGETAAIIGRTGAGKTSLLLSVLQLVPYTGKIAVGGQDLADLLPEDVRSRIVGVVPQTPVIFAGDLRWNVDPDCAASDEEITEVLRSVGLQPTLRGGRPGLVSTATGAISGDTGDLALSQGQRQLLCAARVLLRHPKVVMLDEVSASLPAKMACGVVSSLIQRFKEDDASLLLVTHQEELIQYCERVVTIAAGRVVGDHRVGV